MSEGQQASAGSKATDHNVNETDELSRASEAASEHALRDAEPERDEEFERLRNEIVALNDKYLRLHAEFDNARKRNMKERAELIMFAGENALNNMLPVLDDMERAIKNNEEVDDAKVLKQGFALVHSKLLNIFGAQGVRPMPDAKGQPFDVDRHEAITKAPAPSDKLKGKVIEVIENGYTLNDKVIRYAKVVVGE